MVESVRTHRLIILIRLVVWRITVKKAVRPVILADELYAVLVLDDHLLQPAGRCINRREVVPERVRLAAEGAGPCCVAVPDDGIITGGSPDIGQHRL